MKSRDLLRPVIPSIKKELASSPEEAFQNETVRPVVKMLHELLITYFLEHIKLKNVDLSDMSIPQKQSFIMGIFQKDLVLRNKTKGMIIGQFEFDEFNTYLTMQKDINKRIISIVQERVINTLA